MKKILFTLIAVLGIAINSYSQTPINNTMTEDEIYSTSFTIVNKVKSKSKKYYFVFKDLNSSNRIVAQVTKADYKQYKIGNHLSGTRVMSIKE